MRTATLLWTGYGLLVAVVIVIASTSMLTLDDLSTAVETILRENYDSVVAAEDMIEALERQDSAVLAVLLGRAAEGASTLADARATFQVALARARSNITLPDEEAAVRVIERAYSEYVAETDRLVAAAGGDRWPDYGGRTIPRFLAVKQAIFAVIELNQNAMLAQDARAQALARKRSWQLGLLSALGLFAAVAIGHTLGRHVLRPLALLTAETRALGEGEMHRRARPYALFEFRKLAGAINQLADRLAEAHAAREVGASGLRRLITALLEQQDKPTLVLDRAFRTVLGNRRADVVDAGRNGSERLAEVERLARNAVEAGHTEFEVPAQHAVWSIRPLHVREGEAVGYLAQRLRTT